STLPRTRSRRTRHGSALSAAADFAASSRILSLKVSALTAHSEYGSRRPSRGGAYGFRQFHFRNWHVRALLAVSLKLTILIQLCVLSTTLGQGVDPSRSAEDGARRRGRGERVAAARRGQYP